MVAAPTTATPGYDVTAPLEERLRSRLDDLKANREKFIITAQQQLAALDAAIAELGALLDPAVVQQNGSRDADAT